MELYDLNITLLTEKEARFDKVEGELSTHIDKLEADAKEVQLGVVRLIVNKAKKLLKMMEENLTSKKPLLELSPLIEKQQKQLGFLKAKLQTFRDNYKDNKFEKGIMNEVDKILKDLIGEIGTASDGADDKIDDIVKSIAKETSDEVQKKRVGKKIPKGLAQDLNTHKLGVAKNKK